MLREKGNRLPFKIVRTWSGIESADKALEELNNLVSWQQQPGFPKVGRCAYLIKNDINFTGRSAEPMLVKLKGIGYKSHRNGISQPENVAMQNRNPHLGFDEEGNFIHICSDPAPLGGLCLKRAIKEFSVAQKLVNAGCPSALPLRVYEYTSKQMFFINPVSGLVSNLAVAATCLPTSYPHRADALYHYKCCTASEKMMLEEWMQQLAIKNIGHVSSYLKLMKKLTQLFGSTLRRFSEAGFYRYSCAPDNYTYIPKYNEVFIVDFDSCMELAYLNEKEKPLQIMRDIASGLAYQFTYLTKPTNIAYWDLEDILATDPFCAFLEGYFPEIDPLYIKQVASPLHDYYKKVYQYTLTHYKDMVKPLNSKSFRLYLENSFIRPWISRSESFANVMPIVYLLFRKSRFDNLKQRLPNFNHFIKNITQYTSSKVVTQIYQSFEKHGLLSQVK